jgi:hypothetical protein
MEISAVEINTDQIVQGWHKHAKEEVGRRRGRVGEDETESKS